MTARQGIGRANGKIILIGEHSVVYAQPAIAIPFKEVAVTTTITAADSLTVDCIYHQGALEDAPVQLDNLRAVVSSSLSELGMPDQTFHIKIESTIPVERGMGSSAAVANSVVRAIFSYFDETLDDDTLFRLTQVSETIAHGNPSGLDAKITVSDQPLYFIRGETLEPFDIHLKGFIVVGDTGEKGRTMLAVNALGERRRANPEATNALIQELGGLSNRTKAILAGDRLEPLGECMNKAQDALAQMGISNAVLDSLIDAAKANGALGAKLTGGGWGGCMLALTADPDAAREMQQKLIENGAKETWVLEL